MRKVFYKSFGVAFVAMLLTVGTAWGQARPQADVQVQSITAAKTSAGNLDCAVTVFSFWDDAARDARVQILLPPGYQVTALPVTCSATQSPDGTHANIACQLGNIQVGQTVTVPFTLTPLYSSRHKTLGAFAWSQRPDPVPGNNYREILTP